jgi:hypothetical protein
VFRRKLADADIVYSYDAAGHNVSLFGAASNNRIISVVYDGDGAVTKRTETQQNTQASLTYYVRFSVLGGRIVAELNQSGQKQKGYVFANGEVLAEQLNNGVNWRHENPITGGQGISSTNGGFDAQAEPDPTGVNVGFEDPFINCCSLPEPNDQITPMLLGSSGGGHCSLDGMSIDCSWAMEMLESGAALQCPNDDCGPRTMNAYDANGNLLGRVLSQPFQAFADGYSGFLPPGARYQGNGYWAFLGSGGTSRNGPPTLGTFDRSRPRMPASGNDGEGGGRLGLTPDTFFDHPQNPGYSSEQLKAAVGGCTKTLFNVSMIDFRASSRGHTAFSTEET